MDKGDDPYVILGISQKSTESEIKKAYRKLALKYHPDRQKTDEDKALANGIFAKVSDAYHTVGDPVKLRDWRDAHERYIRKQNNGCMEKRMPRSRPKSASSSPPSARNLPKKSSPQSTGTTTRVHPIPPPPPPRSTHNPQSSPRSLNKQRHPPPPPRPASSKPKPTRKPPAPPPPPPPRLRPRSSVKSPSATLPRQKKDEKTEACYGEF